MWGEQISTGHCTLNQGPKSVSKYLFLQVEEQSDICDVTVEVGLWVSTTIIEALP